jgi:hypothetical protein
VAHHAHSGIGGEHALEPAGGRGRAVGHDDLPGVLGKSDAHAAAVMK